MVLTMVDISGTVTIMPIPDLDRLQEMLGDEWKLTDEQRVVITAWWDAHMSGETASVVQGRKGQVVVPVSTKRGTRLAEDWHPSTNVAEELMRNYPGVNLRMILEEFRDYWCAVPGSRGLKLSWDRTFRNRVREVAHKPQYRRQGISMQGGGQMSRVDSKAAEYLK